MAWLSSSGCLDKAPASTIRLQSQSSIRDRDDRILLVQGFHANRWSFPGGKVNENETLMKCAAREVMEETGIDIEHRLRPEIYIDRGLGETLRRAYIVEGLPRTSKLKPTTRNEIEAITWFNVSDLPKHSHDQTPMEKMNVKPLHFLLVMPFIGLFRH
ncbi:unnamed protein product [Protopolystoma xenopodis]|uniref:mRNA-decapping enzyme 2 n=1 Tax=Protopolystoma xenopodis TaxID=117903 RepID=A0A3S5FE91_9PLAT|nr:unnamed protein product [Protopolystoma xenopodis]